MVSKACWMLMKLKTVFLDTKNFVRKVLKLTHCDKCMAIVQYEMLVTFTQNELYHAASVNSVKTKMITSAKH